MTTPQTTPEPLACPFCGGKAHKTFVSDFRISSPRTGSRVTCGQCSAQSAAFGTEDEAIAAWNRRATTSGVTAAPQEGVSVPPGFALVPTRPTTEMIDAGMEGLGPCVGSCGEASPPERTDMRDCFVAMVAAAPQPPASALPDTGNVGADEPYNGADWELLAMALASEEHDDIHQLIWEGGPVPEPWGEVWQKYEGDARRMIELVQKHATALPPGRGMVPMSVDQIDSFGQQIDRDGSAWPKFLGEGEKRHRLVRAVEAHHGIKEGSATPLGDGEGAR